MDRIICPGCDKSLHILQVANHISLCDLYPQPILRQIKRLNASTPENDIKFMQTECELALEHLKKLLQKEPIYESSKACEYRDYDDDLLSCICCEMKVIDNTKVICIDDCCHFVCVDCLSASIEKDFVAKDGVLFCPAKGCSAPVSVSTIKRIAGDQKYQTLMNRVQAKMLGQGNYVTCGKCKEVFSFQEGDPRDAPAKVQNRALERCYAQHYSKFRFSCRKCRTDQCMGCKVVPYHLGRTCQEQASYATVKKCRFCANKMGKTVREEPALADICRDEECEERAKDACLRILACGHPCSGERGEHNCLACLHQDCVKTNKELGRKGIDPNDYCKVCHTEALCAAPCLQLKCGHIFHLHCLRRSFNTRWLTPRIFFNFLQCTLCRQTISVDPACSLQPFVQTNLALKALIQEMAMKRLKFQELEKNDKKLTDPTSDYYGKPQVYAMLLYAYFECFECKRPYFGGRRDCVAAMADPNEKDIIFNPKELVCAGCCKVPIESCKKHGNDSIAFKCKFCCEIATWFCWGNTHFCEECHKKQCNSINMNKIPKPELPKCKGPGLCPSGGRHEGNGEERSLGCSLCLSVKENGRDF